MTSPDYRIMQWHSAMDGPWSADAVRRFRQQGNDGLVIIPSANWTPQDLSFLIDLAGLRSFSFTGKLRDDLEAFRVATLEELTLVTGSKLAIPDGVQTEMSRLCLTDRPGLVVGQRWPQLDWLRVGTWKGIDLTFLDKATKLRHLRLEGRRQQGSLDGIQDCAKIGSLIAINYSVLDIEPLRELNALSEIRLLAAKPTAPHGPLDLSHVTSQRLTRLWISNASQLQNLDSLATHPALREVRLIGCQLSDADSRILAAFPKQIDVQLVND